MKKILIFCGIFAFLSIILSLTGCGPSAAEQKRQDSIRVADSLYRADSIRMADSLATVRKQQEDSIAANKKMDELVAGHKSQLAVKVPEANVVAYVEDNDTRNRKVVCYNVLTDEKKVVNLPVPKSWDYDDNYNLTVSELKYKGDNQIVAWYSVWYYDSVETFYLYTVDVEKGAIVATVKDYCKRY